MKVYLVHGIARTVLHQNYTLPVNAEYINKVFLGQTKLSFLKNFRRANNSRSLMRFGLSGGYLPIISVSAKSSSRPTTTALWGPIFLWDFLKMKWGPILSGCQNWSLCSVLTHEVSFSLLLCFWLMKIIITFGSKLFLIHSCRFNGMTSFYEASLDFQ